MTEAERCERITDGKNVPQTEKLVSESLLNQLKFWRSLMNNSPLYGADVAGSLFDKGVAWNLVEIQTLLKKGLDGLQIKGVSSPYVYVGQWKAMFGWHKEDLDLYSINYLHHGKPKFWYSVNMTDN